MKIIGFAPEELATLPKGKHNDGNGLYLQVLSPGNGGSWVFRYQRGGKDRNMGLGTCPTDPTKIEESRAKAHANALEAQSQLQAGQDPLDAKRAQRAKPAASERKTFRECAAAYVAAHRASWKSVVHARQWEQILDDYVLPRIGRLDAGEVGPGDVESVLAPMWRKKPEVARKTAGKVGMILDYAIARGYRTAPNVASLRIMSKLLGPLNQKPRHHPAIPYKQIPDFMAKLDGRNDISALAMQWLILTATRSGEARCPTWAEIDKAKALWTIPAARMKAGEEHIIPLSAAALAVLKRVPRTTSPCVFVAQGDAPVTETALRNVLRDLEVTKDAGSLHGFRSSFRDWGAENGYADDVMEACLAHAVPDAVVRAYKRTKFLAARTDVMQAWGLFVS